ncbi:MAG: helix-turn-helix domain-containing protein [Parvularculaceae bacterium]
MARDNGSYDDLFAVRKRRLIARLAMETASVAFGAPMERLASSQRCGAQVALARQAAMYLAHVVGQLPLSSISTEFNRDRTTVSHACHLIEDRRDSPMFDMQIEILETYLRERLNTAVPELTPGQSDRSRTRRAAASISYKPCR